MTPSSRVPCFCFIICLVFEAATAHAQAPVITAAGDPSVKSDTIYALAPDPATRPEDAALLLFDDAVLSVDRTGRGTRTFRQVVHVLRQQAVAGFAERRLRYSPDQQKLRINWVRVLKPNGEVISEGPAQQQEADVALAVTNPVYVNQKEIRLSLGGVAANTIIDISYTYEETQPYLEGDFFAHWNVHSSMGLPVLRNRFLLDVPAQIQPRVSERNLNFAVKRNEATGRRTLVWATSDVPRYRAEPFSPDTSPGHMYVVTSLPLTWSDVTKWYDALSRDRYTLTPAAQAKVREVVARATSRTDTIRALHRWIAQDIRYVSVSLGIGGYQPRTPEQTITTGFGDCKDKATLFIAALRSFGIEAHPVLLNVSAAAVRREHPSIRQFNHMIAAVKQGGTYTFTDLTAGAIPYGELPWPQQGGFALIVLPGGSAEEIRLPKHGPDARRIHYDIVATLAEDGTMSGYMEETNTGQGFDGRRTLFAAPLDSTRRAALMRGLVGPFQGATGDSIVAFDGRDLYAPVRYKLWFSRARGTQQTGGLHLFTFPFGVLAATNRIRQIEAAGPRRAPIVAEEVLRALPPTQQTIDMRVTLPEGWRARVPEDVIVTGDFGRYSTEYSQEGRVLRIVRREDTAMGTYPASRLPDVIQFFRAIGADENNRTIVIDPGGAR